MGRDDLLDHGRIVQGRHIAEVSRRLHGNLPKDPPHNLPGASLRQSPHHLRAATGNTFTTIQYVQRSTPKVPGCTACTLAVLTHNPLQHEDELEGSSIHTALVRTENKQYVIWNTAPGS